MMKTTAAFYLLVLMIGFLPACSRKQAAKSEGLAAQFTQGIPAATAPETVKALEGFVWLWNRPETHAGIVRRLVDLESAGRTSAWAVNEVWGDACSLLGIGGQFPQLATPDALRPGFYIVPRLADQDRVVLTFVDKETATTVPYRARLPKD